jgi:hypothetical protein
MSVSFHRIKGAHGVYGQIEARLHTQHFDVESHFCGAMPRQKMDEEVEETKCFADAIVLNT